MFGRNKPCETHDKASPYKIAKLEVETGIDPDALSKLMPSNWADPDIIGCNNRGCNRTRG
jgi:hypothetical protein